MKIKYATQSEFFKPCEEIAAQAESTSGRIISIETDLGPGGYDGSALVTITANDSTGFETDWKGEAPTRFPARIKAAATVLYRRGWTGHFLISHKQGRIKIEPNTHLDSNEKKPLTPSEDVIIPTEITSDTASLVPALDIASPAGSPPQGTKAPISTSVTVTQYARDPAVKQWVLNQAQGVCECCGAPAPFIDANGVPYLEVHHVKPLAEGGSDTIENTVAICPNCHRELHYGAAGAFLTQEMYDSVSRLVQE